MDLKGKRVLVTGGAGFLGRHVCEVLRERGADVLAPKRDDLDLLDETGDDLIVALRRSDAVVHCAATCGGIGRNIRTSAMLWTYNLLMGSNLLLASEIDWSRRLVLIGTCCSYPKDAPLPLREENLWDGYPEPTNAPYGLAKRAVIDGMMAYRRQYGLNAVAVIPANLYGPGDHFNEDGHVIPGIIQKVSEAAAVGAPAVQLWGDGSPTRDFLHVRDAAEGIVRALEEDDCPEIVNLGTERETSIAEVADMVRRAKGWGGVFAWDSSKPNGQPRRVVSSARAMKHLGWMPRVRLEDGIRETLQWYEAQHMAGVT